MKIREIFELNQKKTMSLIAKEDLPAGEKRVYAILKSLGAKTPEVGKREWTYENVSEADLDKDFTEFLPQRKNATGTAKNKTKASNSKSTKTNKNESNGNSKKTIEYRSMDDTIKNVSNDSEKDDGMIAEIQALIKGKSKDENTRVYKGIYFDKDIAEFLDNVQHGNKSEIVNKILRQYLTENRLM